MNHNQVAFYNPLGSVNSLSYHSSPIVCVKPHDPAEGRKRRPRKKIIICMKAILT